jgi:hypothetical protein
VKELEQHDIQELTRFLLENLENHMPGEGGRIIPALYQGKMITEVRSASGQTQCVLHAKHWQQRFD